VLEQKYETDIIDTGNHISDIFLATFFANDLSFVTFLKFVKVKVLIFVGDMAISTKKSTRTQFRMILFATFFVGYINFATIFVGDIRLVVGDICFATVFANDLGFVTFLKVDIVMVIIFIFNDLKFEKTEF
jgi:hypothetical protein